MVDIVKRMCIYARVFGHVYLYVFIYMNTCRYIHMYRLYLCLQLHCCPPIFVDGWRKNNENTGMIGNFGIKLQSREMGVKL